jgi:hypothetical protein
MPSFLLKQNSRYYSLKPENRLLDKCHLICETLHNEIIDRDGEQP